MIQAVALAAETGLDGAGLVVEPAVNHGAVGPTGSGGQLRGLVQNGDPQFITRKLSRQAGANDAATQ